jgi:hypothetical protein
MGLVQPVDQLPTPSGAEVMCGGEDTLMASLNAVCLLGHLRARRRERAIGCNKRIRHS